MRGLRVDRPEGAGPEAQLAGISKMARGTFIADSIGSRRSHGGGEYRADDSTTAGEQRKGKGGLEADPSRTS